MLPGIMGTGGVQTLGAKIPAWGEFASRACLVISGNTLGCHFIQMPAPGVGGQSPVQRPAAPSDLQGQELLSVGGGLHAETALT